MLVPLGPFFTLFLRIWRRFVPSEDTLRQEADRLRTDILFTTAAQASADEAAKNQQTARRKLAEDLRSHDLAVYDQRLTRDRTEREFQKVSQEKTVIEIPWWKFWLNNGVLRKLKLRRTRVKDLSDSFIQCGHELQLAEGIERQLSDVLRGTTAKTNASAQEGAEAGREKQQQVAG